MLKEQHVQPLKARKYSGKREATQEHVYLDHTTVTCLQLGPYLLGKQFWDKHSKY